MAGFNLGDIFVTFKAKTDNFKRGLNNVRNDVNGFGRSVRDRVGTMGAAAFGALRASAVVAGVAIMGFITKFIAIGGFNRALNIEDAKAKLKGLGYSMKEVESITNSTLNAVRGTAFSLDQGMTIAASAMAAGVKQGKDLEKYLKTVGDAATIAGSDLSEMDYIFNKVQANGRMMTEEMNQLSDRGIPILQWLAKEYGVSASAMRDMVSEGAVDAARFRKVISENIGGAALESGSTTRGAWRNTQAAMARVGAAIANKIIPQIRNGLGTITEWFDANSDRIVGGAEKIAEGFAKLGNWIGKLVGKENIIAAIAGGLLFALIPAIIMLGKFLIGTLAPVAMWIAIGALLAIGIKKIADRFGGLSAVAQKVGDMFTWLRGIINGDVTSADLADGKFKSLVQTFERLWPTIQMVAGIIARSFTVAIHLLIAAFNFLWPSIKSLGETFIKDLLPALKQAWDAIVRLWQALNPALMVAIGVIAAVIGGLLIGAIWLLINGFKVGIAIISGVISILSNLVKWFSNVIKWAGNLAGAIWNFQRQAYSAFASVWRTVSSIANRIRGIFQSLPGWLRGPLGTITKIITAPFRTAFNAISSLWNNTVGKLNFKAPDWVPGIGGKGFTMPQLPKLAMGTPNWRGGIAGMNEFGPETAVLPKGTRVLTADDTRRGNGAGNNGDVFNIYVDGVYARSKSDLRDVGESIIAAVNERRMAQNKPIIGGA